MTNDQISKEEIEGLMKEPGEFIGGTLQMTARYVRAMKGEDGLRKLEEEMKKMGHPIDFERIRTLDWYPIGLRALTLIALNKIFNWGEKGLVEFGENMIVFNPLMKIAARYLISTEKLFRGASDYWSKNHTRGRLESYKFDKKEKYAIVRLHDFKIHSNFCFLFLGYFKRMAQFSGLRNVTIQETGCMFKGDPYHEYTIRWG